MTTQTPADDGPVPPTGTTPPPGTAASPAAGFFTQLRGIGLYRSEERWIGGVAGGLAARFGLDPLLVRGIFLVTLLLGGFGLVLYALAWALLPEERDGRIHLEGLTLGHPDIALLGALLLFVGGVGRGAWNDWPFVVPGWIQGMFWLGATILVIVLVTQMLQHRRPPVVRPAPAPFAGAPYGGGSPYGGGAPYTGPAAPSGPTGPLGGPAVATASYGGPVPAYGPTSPAGTGPATPRVSAPVPPASTWTPPPAPGPAPMPYRYAPAPAPSPAPPRPPRPPRRGPGAAITGITVALSLFVVAGALIAQRTGWHDQATAGTAAALIVVVFGVAIIVSGLRGRRSGVLGFLAIVAMIAALPIAVTTRDGLNPWIVDRNGVHVTTSQGTTTVTDRSSAADGYDMAFGDSTLDLTRVPIDPEERLTVPVDLSAGNLVILVPKDADVAAQADIGAGQVTWKVDGDNVSASGFGRRDDFGVPADEADLLLTIDVGAGNVTIEEGTR